MDATALTFGLKDVVAIVIGAITVVSFIFALINSNKSNKLAIDTLRDSTHLEIETLKNSTGLAHEVNAKDLAQHKIDYTSNMLSLRSELTSKINNINNDRKSELKAVYEEVQQNRADTKLMITEIKQEQKEEYSKLSAQITSMNNQINNISANLSELTGWVKANQQNQK